MLRTGTPFGNWTDPNGPAFASRMPVLSPQNSFGTNGRAVDKARTSAVGPNNYDEHILKHKLKVFEDIFCHSKFCFVQELSWATRWAQNCFHLWSHTLARVSLKDPVQKVHERDVYQNQARDSICWWKGERENKLSPIVANVSRQLKSAIATQWNVAPIVCQKEIQCSASWMCAGDLWQVAQHSCLRANLHWIQKEGAAIRSDRS